MFSVYSNAGTKRTTLILKNREWWWNISFSDLRQDFSDLFFDEKGTSMVIMLRLVSALFGHYSDIFGYFNKNTSFSIFCDGPIFEFRN